MSKISSPKRWGRGALSALLTSSLFGLAACSGMPRQSVSLPSDAELAALPVIQLGQTKPVQGEYIVYVPASQSVHTVATVQGSLFARTDTKTLTVQLKRDIYLYKNWISFDKLEWVKSTDAVTGKVQVRLPNYDEPQEGEIVIQLDAKS